MSAGSWRHRDAPVQDTQGRSWGQTGTTLAELGQQHAHARCPLPWPLQPQSPALLDPPAASPAASSPYTVWPGPAWVPQEGSRSADASIATAQDMRSAWIQQFQLISSPILQQFSEPVGCFCLCKRPLSRTVAPFPFSTPRRGWGTAPVWLNPSSGSGTTIPHTGSPSAQPPAPCRAAGTAPVECSPACGAGAPASMGRRALQPQSRQSKAALAPNRAAMDQALEHPLRCPDPLPQEKGEQ